MLAGLPRPPASDDGGGDGDWPPGGPTAPSRAAVAALSAFLDGGAPALPSPGPTRCLDALLALLVKGGPAAAAAVAAAVDAAPAGRGLLDLVAAAAGDAVVADAAGDVRDALVDAGGDGGGGWGAGAVGGLVAALADPLAWFGAA
jgi:hypothetical protein